MIVSEVPQASGLMEGRDDQGAGNKRIDWSSQETVRPPRPYHIPKQSDFCPNPIQVWRFIPYCPEKLSRRGAELKDSGRAQIVDPKIEALI